MTSESKAPKSIWQWGWVAWIVAFLLQEIPAAITEGKGTRTLSKFVWRWFSFDGHRRFWVARRSVFILFWIYLGCHFVLMAPWWPVMILGIGVAACIVYSIAAKEGDLVGLKDKVVKWVALKWLGGQAKNGKSMIGKILKFADGWKLQISVLVLFGFKVWDALHNGHTGDFVGAVMTALNWAPPGGWTGENMTIAVTSAVALFGFFAKLYKAKQQSNAGATIGELMSPVGYIKAAAVDGTLANIISEGTTVQVASPQSTKVLAVTNDDLQDPVVLKVAGVAVVPAVPKV